MMRFSMFVCCVLLYVAAYSMHTFLPMLCSCLFLGVFACAMLLSVCTYYMHALALSLSHSLCVHE